MSKLKVFPCRLVFKFTFVFLLLITSVNKSTLAGQPESELNHISDLWSLNQLAILQPFEFDRVGEVPLRDDQPRLILSGQKFNTISLDLQIRGAINSTKLIPQQASAEIHTPTPQQGSIRKDRLVMIGSGLALTNLYLYQRFKDIWWYHNRSKFHLYRGWRRTTGWWDLGPHDSLWYHMDKLGHIYNARLVSEGLSDIARWVGLSDNQSDWAGAILSSAFFFEIEFFDGHYDDWGFSVGDFLANEIGAFLPILCDRFPHTSYFTLKWSYHSSPEIVKEQYLIEDYAGMTFWLSSNVWSLLPRNLKNYWPSWLNLALGYGVSQKAHGQIELYLALDYDLTKVNVKNPLVRKVLEYLNYIHFPAPTLQFRPIVKGRWLYF